MNAEQLAQLFHETHERLAPDFGYATRKETAIPWQNIPADSSNKRLMIAVAGEVLQVVQSEQAKENRTLREIIKDFIVHVTKYHMFWETEKVERDALLARSREMEIAFPPKDEMVKI